MVMSTYVPYCPHIRLMILLFSIYEVCFVYRKACLDTFGNMQFILRNFSTSNTDMTLLEMSFLLYSGGVSIFLSSH